MVCKSGSHWMDPTDVTGDNYFCHMLWRFKKMILILGYLYIWPKFYSHIQLFAIAKKNCYSRSKNSSFMPNFIQFQMQKVIYEYKAKVICKGNQSPDRRTNFQTGPGPKPRPEPRPWPTPGLGGTHMCTLCQYISKLVNYFDKLSFQ
jgi:hypothetical protein